MKGTVLLAQMQRYQRQMKGTVLLAQMQRYQRQMKCTVLLAQMQRYQRQMKCTDTTPGLPEQLIDTKPGRDAVAEASMTTHTSDPVMCQNYTIDSKLQDPLWSDGVV